MQNKFEYGQRIKNTRKEVNITQQELADKTGMAVNSIRRYESGEIIPRADAIERIANALDVTTGFLMSDEITTEKDYQFAVKWFGKDGAGLPETLEEMKKMYGEDIRFQLSSSDDKPRETQEGNILLFFRRLNPEGKAKAVEIVEILSKVPDYQQDHLRKDE